MTWQPIESAPKTGEEILVIDNSGSCSVVSWNPRPEGAKPGFQVMGCGWRAWCGGDEHDVMVHNLTHWMPIPPPPESDIKPKYENVCQKCGASLLGKNLHFQIEGFCENC